MNILVVGATGTLGRFLCRQLLDVGHHLVIIVRNKSYDLITDENLVYIQMDLTDINLRRLPVDIDVVYYLAQSRRYREFPDGAEDMLDVNINAPVKLANWAVKHQISTFIYASSGGVYPNPEEPVKEFFDISLHKTSGFYIGSKLAAELLLNNYNEYFETFNILRPFFIYGPEQNEQMLIPRLIRNIQHQTPITINGDDGIVINPIYASDAAEVCVRLLENKGTKIINVAGNEPISLKELALKIGKELRIQPVFSYIDKPANNLIGDISLMKDVFVPQISLDEGIKRMIHNDI